MSITNSFNIEMELPINLTTVAPTLQLNSMTHCSSHSDKQSRNIVPVDSVKVKQEIVTHDDQSDDDQAAFPLPSSLQERLSMNNCTLILCKKVTEERPINLSRSLEVVPISQQNPLRPFETKQSQNISFDGVVVKQDGLMLDARRSEVKAYDTRPSILQNSLSIDNCTAVPIKVEIGDHPIDLSQKIAVLPTSNQDSMIPCVAKSDGQPDNVAIPFETVFVKQEEVSTEEEMSDSNAQPCQPVLKDCLSRPPILKDSLSSDNSTGKFQCRSCSKKFKTKNLLTNHLLTDFPSQPCKCTCQYCMDIFATETLLIQHVRSSHPNERFYKCSICGAGFNLKPVLKAHFITHSTERPYQCSACLKSFQRRGSLKEHMLIHTNRKPFTCSEQGCDKSFSTRKYLVNHRIVHQSDRPHVCTICNNTFKHRSALAHHLITHTTDRPFSCTECDKSFQMRGSLKEHMQVHNCEGPFKCPEPGCDKSFITRRYLSSHIVVHEEDRSNPCPKCNRIYKHKKALARHLKRCQTYDIC